ncbi:MAG: pirin family protein [Gammaproteobacteria bacterium]|nr:pirin family protein [Gammaproteobacteria bacterium]
MNATRKLLRRVASVPTSDGAGVKLRRSLGARPDLRLDPLLMLDEFYSDDPRDYLAGFPPHPHRGFETVTYMLDGHMRHEDHLGNQGDLGPGGLQWMTAGRGIIHSEMPQQTEGRMRGFQLWINLPAAEKMQPARYRDIQADAIAELTIEQGRIRVLAGRLTLAGRAVAGPINGEPDTLSTDPLYVDVRLGPDERLDLPVPRSHNAFLYAFEGQIAIGGSRDGKGEVLDAHEGAILGAGDHVTLEAGPDGARLLLIAGRPIGEPVAQYGPFVMNTREELEQALADYRDGRLAEPV